MGLSVSTPTGDGATWGGRQCGMEGRREREQGRSGEATEKTDEGSNEETAQPYAYTHTYRHTHSHTSVQAHTAYSTHTLKQKSNYGSQIYQQVHTHKHTRKQTHVELTERIQEKT